MSVLILTGQRLTADALNAAYGIPTITKPSNTSRTSTTTVTDDPDLSGIALGVGTWEVVFRIFAFSNAGTAAGLKTSWGFTGSVNTALVRHCQGPGRDNTAVSDVIVDVVMRGVAMSSGVLYGLGFSSAAYSQITEASANVVVTVAGNLSLQWAQQTSNATATTVAGESYVTYRQIA